MSVFDMRHQTVTNQTNNNYSFGEAQNQADLIIELEKLKSEVSNAGESKVINAEIVTEVQEQIQKAVDQAKKPEPNKDVIAGYLSTAKGFMKGVAEAGGIVAGIVKAIELVQKLF
ncbi:conserved hypothetical protein [Microcystis aeruginosa PCC 9807]|jgi:galactitol-specific phosphotransferase system IIB component|uniref:Uncharacterized protein n=1 Tax=Microcystis aeruginosa PCC 9807 TaxID=1160283 RepID=I4H6S7_MICAE|nr:hypothetical protein [Microcystis aeruginosa]CCI17751.1 conserved hypothetical protein [Microcystis aeruginosa PCC 9807]